MGCPYAGGLVAAGTAALLVGCTEFRLDNERNGIVKFLLTRLSTLYIKRNRIVQLIGSKDGLINEWIA